MSATLFVTYLILAAACVSATPILVSECSVLNVPLATYQLTRDVTLNASAYEGFVCFDITSNGITLDGNGFRLSAPMLMDASAVRYSGSNATIRNLVISGFKTGILAKGKFGKIEHNIISQAANGIDVVTPYADISHNTIRDFSGVDTASAIYVYFPSVGAPIDAFVNIVNNVISNIQADTFALGVSVYSATSVKIMNNRIFNLQGALAQEISIIEGEAELKGNVFDAPTTTVDQSKGDDEAMPISSATLLSLAAVLVSALWFFAVSSSPSSIPTPLPIPQKEDEVEDEEEDKAQVEKKKEEEKEKERKEKEEKEKGPSVVSRFSFHVGSSPATRSPSFKGPSF